jgi:GTP cyclohydrolase I
MNRTQSVEELVQKMLLEIGEDPTRQGLVETPRRVAKSFKEMTRGYGQTAGDVIENAMFESDSTGYIIQKGTEFYSVCEHHLLPFFGEVHLAYVPNGRIIGLSKIGRVIDVFAHRLQVQERLTEELADAFEKALNPKVLAIKIEAQHFCMMMRGVKKQNGKTITTATRGSATTDPQVRSEIFSHLSY